VTGERRLFRALLQPFIVAHTAQARDLRDGHERFHEWHQNRTNDPGHGIDFRPITPARLLQRRGIFVCCSGQSCMNKSDLLTLNFYFRLIKLFVVLWEL